MRTALFFAPVLAMLFVTAGWAQAPKKKPPEKQKKADDLPNVALEIPTDTPPGVKAIILDKVNVLQDKRSKPSERAKACQVLGELGEQGRPTRRALCRAMLDASPSVSEAAADALKKIDPGIQKWAVDLVIEAGQRREKMEGIQLLADKGEPLTPLVLHYAGMAHVAGDFRLLGQGLITLSRIAPNDLGAYEMIVWALSHPDGIIRQNAIAVMPLMKHGRKAVPKILVLLKSDVPTNQLSAISALTALADESNEESIMSAVTALRFHKEASVRQAVDQALNKLKARNP